VLNARTAMTVLSVVMDLFFKTTTVSHSVMMGIITIKDFAVGVLIINARSVVMEK
jgi:hypothetical protein